MAANNHDTLQLIEALKQAVVVTRKICCEEQLPSNAGGVEEIARLTKEVAELRKTKEMYEAVLTVLAPESEQQLLKAICPEQLTKRVRNVQTGEITEVPLDDREVTIDVIRMLQRQNGKPLENCLKKVMLLTHADKTSQWPAACKKCAHNAQVRLNAMLAAIRGLS